MVLFMDVTPWPRFDILASPLHHCIACIGALCAAFMPGVLPPLYSTIGALIFGFRAASILCLVMSITVEHRLRSAFDDCTG